MKATRGVSPRIRPLLLLAPAVTFTTVMLVWPLASLLLESFDGVGAAVAALADLVLSRSYRVVLISTLLRAIWVTCICVVVAIPVAYLLGTARGVLGKIVSFGVLFPFWISLLVRTYSWLLLLASNGPVNRLLVGSGLAQHPLPLLYNEFGVSLGMVHVLLPYAIILIHLRMRSLDAQLLSASDSLGASPTMTFLRVYLPQLWPGLIAAASVVFVLALGFFVTPLLLGGAKATTIATLIYDMVMNRLDWAHAAAASLILLFVTVAILVPAARFLRNDRIGTGLR
jgi:ABC-type spermidine/putrescine transport system permease subunit I